MKKKIRVFFYFLILISVFRTAYAKDVEYTNFDRFLKKLDVESDYKDKIKDNSIILLQVDRLSNKFLNAKYGDSEITPNLNKLISSEGDNLGAIYFNNFYEIATPGSEEVEFTTLNSLYPHPNVNSSIRNLDRNTLELPKILGNNLYDTSYFYISSIYNRERLEIAKNQGFKNTGYLGASNDALFDKIIKSIDSDKRFIYAFSDSNSSYKVNNDFEIKDKNTLVSDVLYLNYVDSKIGEILDKIDEEKDRKYTIIIYGTNARSSEDPNVQSDFSQLFESYSIFDELNMPLIIKTNVNSKNVKIDLNCSAIDITPTILHMIGLNIKTYPIMGDVIFLKNLNERTIKFQNQLKKGSFIKGNILLRVNKLESDYTAIDVSKNESLKPNPYIDLSREVVKEIDLSNGIADLDVMEEIQRNYYNKKNMNLPSNSTILHAGGAINGISYSNMMEALDNGYQNGKRFFEVDFEKTSDNKYVALHSWDGFLKKFFDINPKITKSGVKKPFSYDEFMNFKEVHGYTHMDTKKCMEWLNNHGDAYIITDCKGNNIEFLSQLKKFYKNATPRVIVQIYNFREYDQVKNLGFDNIILTLYRTNEPDDMIINFAKNHRLYGITMDEKRYKTGIGEKLIKNGFSVYVHTVNILEDAEKFFRDGVKGIYTDIL